MGLARSESLFAHSTDYEDDSAARAFEQTELLCSPISSGTWKAWAESSAALSGRAAAS